MNQNKILFFLSFLIIAIQSNAQIQWASELVGFSSELQKDLSSAKQILGPPNVITEDAIFSPCAWTSATPDREVFEFIEVGFSNPQQISSVIISENFNPGAIIEINAFDTLNRKFRIYQKAAGALFPKNKGGRLFVHSFSKTFYKVKKIKVVLASDVVPGFNQIDAIGISSDSGSFKIEINNISGTDLTNEPENLGELINHERGQEFAPVITADGKALYFTRQFHPENIGDTTKQDIWYSEKDEKGNFVLSKNIGNPINNEVHNALIAALPDGNSLILLNKYLPDNKFSEGISSTYRTTDGWSYPTPIEIDSFYNLGKTAEFCLGSDGKTLLMTIQRNDAIGNKDIYVSFKKENGNWTTPKNLGNNVNTADGELSPFLASDGVTLYFSSTGFPGYGGTDMFVTRRLDDSWTKWSEPLNMGPGLNSKGFDAYYTIPASGDYAYFSSSKNGKSSDIYRVRLPESAKPKPVLLVKGKVYNAKTKQPMGASVSYESLNSGKALGIARSNPLNGDFRIVLPSGDNYGFLADEHNFLSVSQNVDLTKFKEYGEVTLDLYLQPVETGAVIQLNNIFFETSKYNLKPEDGLELNRVYKFMTQYPNLVIEISGHTDNVGDDQSNLTLSNNRAKSVTDYLISKGIAANRLKAIGYGKNKPLTSNTSAEGRSKNRRIDLKILNI